VTQPVPRELSSVARRRLLVRGLLRALVSSVGLVTLYFLLPLEGFTSLPVGVPLLVALLILLLVASWQVMDIARSPHPGVRAIEALAVVAPLFLLLFAASYYMLAADDAASFSQGPLTRTDTLYFTVTTFATVGYGDIAPASQTARRIVTGQMLLDLLILGFGIRVFVSAVNRGRQHQETETQNAG
jgi:voltage-gated potassium channel